MAAIAITAANVQPSNQAIIVTNFLAGAAIGQGVPVYKDANNLWQIASATGSAIASAATGITVSSSAGANQPIAVCVSDPAFTLGGAVVAGVAVVLGVAGAVNPVTDVVSTWFTTVIGMPISTTQLKLAFCSGGLAHA